MNQQSTTASPANGASSAHDLFVLTDEQILEIEPDAAETLPVEQPLLAVPTLNAGAASPQAATQSASSATSPRPVEEIQPNAQAGVPVLPEPPHWLAAQMKDPWSGEEARELWNGVLQARSEAAAYRAAFATPEDARALKELYPGGVNEARAAADRARLLNEIDSAYFGVPGSSAAQTSATRADLAQRMLREDPAAFREMVFAGLRALETAEKGSASATSNATLPRLAQAFATNRRDAAADLGTTLSSPAANVGQPSSGGASPAPTATPAPFAAGTANGNTFSVGAQLYPERSRGNAPQFSNAFEADAHVSAYAVFEKAANEDLERSVGAAIAHTIEQALPVAQPLLAVRRNGEAQAGVPALRDRLSAAVRQDVESALKGDRQLGEQIAQILSARRFDNETRAQVVRLIDDRARQLVPSAARRVIGEWTQATLAVHRGNASRSEGATARREVEPAAAQGTLQSGLPAEQAGASSAAFSSQAAQAPPGSEPHRNASRSDARRLDYRKLSDEQILDL